MGYSRQSGKRAGQHELYMCMELLEKQDKDEETISRPLFLVSYFCFVSEACPYGSFGSVEAVSTAQTSTVSRTKKTKKRRDHFLLSPSLCQLFLPFCNCSTTGFFASAEPWFPSSWTVLILFYSVVNRF